MRTPKLITALGICVVLVGCGPNPNFRTEGEYKGYRVTASIEGAGTVRRVAIGKKDGGYISAEDMENDGRFDTIHLMVPKGDPLEALANIDSLEEAYRTVTINRK